MLRKFPTLNYRAQFAILILQLALFLPSAHALKPPHAAPNINLCSDCHSRTGAGFATITSQNVLCINAIGCHNPGGRAEKKSLSTLDASNRFGNLPSVSNAKQSSHGWKIPNLNPNAGVTQTDKWGELATGSQGIALNNKILCTRCHRAHGEKTAYVIHEKFLRKTPKGDYICFQCHAARQISNVRDEKPADKHYSHPVEVNYSSVRTAKPDLFYAKPQNQYSSNPTAVLRLFTTVNVDEFCRITGVKGTGQVICSTCHGPIHSADSNPYTFDNLTTYSKSGNYSTSAGNLLRRYPPSRSNDLCQSCHKVQSHRDFLCSRCHTPHKKAGENNRYLIYENISTPNSGKKAVLFTSTSQMARRWQNDSQPTPVCQVCHTQTRHHRNYSTAEADRTHNYVSGNNYKFCAATCHKHTNKFSHGAGGGGGKVEDCLPCHGHTPGYKFTYNLVNYSSQGTGNRITHATHTENDAAHQRGPNVFCDACHDINNMPYFKTGTDGNGDGLFNLTETNVCDNCHSPGGTYNGVNSVNGSVGAKDNFKAAFGAYSGGGVYKPDGTLRPGKEKWCAGCHDDSPATINSVTAPNVVGNESANYKYGTGYGFYKTGHGLPNTQKYPASGGITSGAGKICTNCHNSLERHIDGAARTFDCSDGCDPTEYRQSYRIKMINGQEPMKVPYPMNDTISNDDFRLCFSCHNTNPFVNATGTNTNSKTAGVNRHNYHLSANTLVYPPDYNYPGTVSRPTCVACHNVHGSTNLAMVRDGKLINREPGLQIWYNNDSLVSNVGTPNPPVPENVPLASSDGKVWIGNSADNLCTGNCHGNVNTARTYRSPYQNTAQAPRLDWTGESGYSSDGATPDSGTSGASFTFRIKYSDANNNPPSAIQVWVDKNDDGDYNDAGEQVNLTGAISSDTNYTDGKLYAGSVTLTRAGDNLINYRFYASDGTYAATGSPVLDSSLQIINNTPTLSWTGETYFTSDGVNPNTGGNGSTFEFRVNYTDQDNDAPTNIEVWVDSNDNGTYEVGEKYAMTAVTPGDTTYSDGKLYTKSLTLSYAGDGNLNYKFYSPDGYNTATGTPASDSVVTVLSSANTPPTLEWEAGTCRTDGVKPVMGAKNADFVFTVKYTDANNNAPASIQVWIDENDNAVYDAGEKYNLTEVDAGDTTYSDGKLYSATRPLAYAGDGILNYKFYASDGTDTGIGVGATGSTLTVVNTDYKVRVGGGSGWYSTIQSAVNAVTGAHTVLVYEGTYNENVSVGSSYNSTTIRSVCGADSTTIQGTGTTYVVYFLSNTGSTLDGFTVTGGVDSGVYLNGSAITVTNSIIRNNSRSSGGGIYSANATCQLTLTNSQVYSNTATTSSGGGISLNGGSTHTITNSTIRNNQANTLDGGGIFYQNGGTLTLTGTTIKDNTAAGKGGGLYANTGTFSINGGMVTGNTATSYGGGIGLSNGSSHVTITNGIVAGNNSSTSGGGIYANAGSITLVNSTVADNTAGGTGKGGGAYDGAGGTFIARNSIFWNNSAGAASTPGLDIYYNGGSVTVEYSLINASTPNIDGSATKTYTSNSYSDPIFVGGAPFDYHIQAVSPAIDQASATYAPALDMEGTSRPQDSADDIGPYEFHLSNNAPVLSWTMEPNYTIGGVYPASAIGGTNFTFRVDYTDAENLAPAVIEVWVDLNDNGTYSSNEKFVMTEADPLDTTYSNGKIYTKTMAMTMAGDGVISYRFNTTDGANQGTGSPISNKTLQVINNAPTTAWTGEVNYTTDGVNPNSGTSLSNFTFRVDYTDLDNTPPGVIQVWIDENDNGDYEDGEIYNLTETNAGDTNYADGKRYSLTRALTFAGNGTFTYKFYATDGIDEASGAPDDGGTVTVTNNVPSLAWTGEANYAADGVNPDSANSGSGFEFRVKYTDADNAAPTSIQVWVDENDNGTYDANEKYNMTETDAGDTAYSDGKLYAKTMNLYYAGDGTLNYRFYASDGTDSAIGTPTSNSAVTVTAVANSAPTLDWTGETNYTTDGVNPNSEAGGSNFTFRVKYADADNQAPSSIQVWVDENDNATYEVGEKFNMTAVDAGDTSYADGKLYTLTRTVPFVADGGVNYRFYASDGIADATGVPASNSSLTVVDPRLVPGEYATIALAVTASVNGDIILVSDGTYSENINYGGKNIIIRSVNGAAVTKIQGTGANSPVVTFSGGETSSAVLDGFTIDNLSAAASAARGISITNSSAPTIKNSIITGNSVTAGVKGGGIYLSAAGATIDNTTITGNASPAGGAGVYATGSGTLTITNSTISSNTVSSSGAGGIYLENRTTQTVITNTTISGNTAASGPGGGIYLNGSPVSMTGGAISGNTLTGTGQRGGGLYLTGAASIATVTGTTVNGNISKGFGGGIHVGGGSSLTFISGDIYSNESQAASGGGVGVYDLGSVLDIKKTYVRGNKSYQNGGGFYVASSGSATITNCIISGNITNATNFNGGGIYNAATTTVMNSTIAGNYAVTYGGGYYGSGTITNSIIWGNNAGTSGAQISQSPTVTYSDIDGGFAGTGNISSSPSFVNQQAASNGSPTILGDFHIQAGSLAANVGTGTGAPADDIDGQGRPIGAGIDMGADEKE